MLADASSSTVRATRRNPVTHARIGRLTGQYPRKRTPIDAERVIASSQEGRSFASITPILATNIVNGKVWQDYAIPQSSQMPQIVEVLASVTNLAPLGSSLLTSSLSPGPQDRKRFECTSTCKGT
jgi:hypothetical protein